MKYDLARAALWIVVYLALALAPMVVAYTGAAPARTFWIEVGVALGFVGLAMMAFQFVLTGRYHHIATTFGLDSMLQYHRQIGLVAFAFILAHPVILFLAEPAYLAFLDPRENLWRALSLSAATAALLLLVATSLWRISLGLSYEWWRVWHGVFSIGIMVVGAAHIVQVGYYVAEPWKQALFVGLSAVAVGLLLNTRLVRPWRMRRRPYRVVEVREEIRYEDDVAWTLALRPDGHRGMRFRPGQFAWITLQETPFSLQQHPYSIASSAEDAPDLLEFTIKVEGDFSASVGEAEPGWSAFLEGPYGYFVPEPDPRCGCVMIVGGVGVTPCMSMLRTFADRADPRVVHLIYANIALEEVIFYGEIERMRERLNLSVTHVLEEPPEDWDGEEGLISKELLDRHIPPENRNGYEYFLCGPKPMMDIAEKALLELGIEQRRILSERFQMV
jgi:predicted ferric reductase